MMQLLKPVTVPTQKPRISFIADEQLLPKLKAWADEEYRTVSNLVESIVKDAVESREGQKQKMIEALQVIKKVLTTDAPEDNELAEAIAAIERGLSD